MVKKDEEAKSSLTLILSLSISGVVLVALLIFFFYRRIVRREFSNDANT